ncbi:endolytic transglycosylase MltG [Geodermatophilus sp. SYSU D00691]
MNEPGAPRPRGRHASPDEPASSVPAPWPPSLTAGSAPGAGARPQDPSRESERWDDDTAAVAPVRQPRRADRLAGASTGGVRRVPGLLDREDDETGPVPVEWRHRGGDPDGPEPGSPRDDAPAGWGGHGADDTGRHPSAPLPPPPPGAWAKLGRRRDGDDDATQAQPVLPGLPGEPVDDATDTHDAVPAEWEEQTGGLEVIGAHVDEGSRRGRRRRRAPEPADLHHDEHDLHDLHDDEHDLHDDEDDHHDDGIPFVSDDGPRRRRRKRRRPLAVLIALVVLAALGAGIFFGGQKLLGLFVSEDYTGTGTGSVDVRVQNGDTLSDIGRTLVAADVIASVGPFVDAAEAEPAAMGITAGVYRMRLQMSGAAALDLLLDPNSRLVSRITLPEGLQAGTVLQRAAEATGIPLADFEAAAADPAALGLPAYANGLLEGWLFPATYDVEPGDTAADVLSGMVTRTTQLLDELGVPEDQRLTVLTKASLVQAEAATAEDMARVARVIENRLYAGMPLQFDTTVNYATGKTGITTTAEDRANPSPYNTYLHAGLPPGPIDNPGEQAVRAVLAPADGNWLFFVVVNPDTGETRFAATAEEHAANVALFQQWLRENPGG